ncbi:type ISP restriction/modification enzyme [Micromonospora sp. RL09-050-HVF-A]|uniref:type ISP restriction/modification enzyme n=1 Tax=unclassified Micromonospora TaxID=2617518 RepID=UPI001C5E8B2B|nr:type ISP restriction/modification enzyme [Micromonospora sp. RL09-050-HVF-A]MBW4703707.1 N-6 DNA methylase [Micromonospora sp. RL09-050-HVF-A]
MNSAWLASALQEFGQACADKLSGPGDAEAAIRAPIEVLLAAVGKRLGLKVVPHDEVRDTERGVRPDYAISVNGAITGYVEVKRPGKSIDPGSFRGHDLNQWLRQRDLPNLIYTNGSDWRLWRDGELLATVTLEGGPLETAGNGLTTPGQEFEQLVTNFLRWSPAPITSVGALVRAIAPLTRLLRGEVLDQLYDERRRVAAGDEKWTQPFLGLASDWRSLLFPQADDGTFADGYAQTVTFALLLARSEGISLTDGSLHDVGTRMAEEHSLMGRALQLLTDNLAGDFRVTLDLLTRVISAVNWVRVRSGSRDTYLHLYENFLEIYDPDLRQRSGSYYTPREVVAEMVRLTESVLKTRLAENSGFSSDRVRTVDPAMGTGTYLHEVISRVADVEGQEALRDGPGAVKGAVQSAVQSLIQRLIGFELQMGPYAVAELRITDLLRKFGAEGSASGMRTYVTDTLDDPYVDVEQLGSGLGTIAASRKRANEVKADVPVTVVIGNPPYLDRDQSQGGWVRFGSEGKASRKRGRVLLDDFRANGNGLAEFRMNTAYVYFWRWACWKVFDAHESDNLGVVCFITPNSYTHGPAFKGMREYLRRKASEGWVINVTPEGIRPDAATRFFPGVGATLAIGIFVRDGSSSNDAPARIRYTEVYGRKEEKYEALAQLELDGGDWREARTGWQDPFTPAAGGAWDSWPALGDLFPWNTTGILANRTWIYSADQEVLAKRWNTITSEPDLEVKRELFKESRDANLVKVKKSLPGIRVESGQRPFREERGPLPVPVLVGFRSFDRQWIIPDHRLIHSASTALWASHSESQVFGIEQHSKSISSGPGIIFTALVPEANHFNNRGGRALPMLHPDGSLNAPPRLREKLSEELGLPIGEWDVAAYIAGVVSHRGFTSHFQDELTTPGVRVPVTRDAELWGKAVSLGKQVIWLHTYGARFWDENEGRPKGNVRFLAGDSRQPLSLEPVSQMPEAMIYDEERLILCLGEGRWGPVLPAVWNYDVGGVNVLWSWFNYRKRNPGGKKTSPLDFVHVESWPNEWTRDLVDLLTVLTRLVELEPEQESLLTRITGTGLYTASELAELGVRWPTVKKRDMSPRYEGSLIQDV